jgi:hypothetical protein
MYIHLRVLDCAAKGLVFSGSEDKSVMAWDLYTGE